MSGWVFTFYVSDSFLTIYNVIWVSRQSVWIFTFSIWQSRPIVCACTLSAWVTFCPGVYIVCLIVPTVSVTVWNSPTAHLDIQSSHVNIRTGYLGSLSGCLDSLFNSLPIMPDFWDSMSQFVHSVSDYLVSWQSGCVNCVSESLKCVSGFLDSYLTEDTVFQCLDSLCRYLDCLIRWGV